MANESKKKEKEIIEEAKELVPEKQEASDAAENNEAQETEKPRFRDRVKKHGLKVFAIGAAAVVGTVALVKAVSKGGQSDDSSDEESSNEAEETQE